MNYRKKLIILGAACFAGFLLLATAFRQTTVFEADILRAIHSGLGNNVNDIVMTTISAIGGVQGVVVMAAALVAFCLLRGRKQPAMMIVALMAGIAVINVATKLLFARARPELWERIVTENTYSFPSGHALGSMGMAIAIVIAFWRTRWRVHAMVVAGLFAFAVGFSRLYLGVHYPTDVMAGWLLAMAWGCAVVVAVLSFSKRKMSAK